MAEPVIYSLEDVARILKLTRRTIYTYVKDGKIKATKIGKSWVVRHEDLEALISGKEGGANR